MRKVGSGASKKRTPEAIGHAAEIMEETEKTSIRQLHQQINLFVGTIHKLLRKDLDDYCLYRTTEVQELLPVDFPRRLEFCSWFVNMNNKSWRKNHF